MRDEVDEYVDYPGDVVEVPKVSLDTKTQARRLLGENAGLKAMLGVLKQRESAQSSEIAQKGLYIADLERRLGIRPSEEFERLSDEVSELRRRLEDAERTIRAQGSSLYRDESR